MIWLTVYEILRVFWEHGFPKKLKIPYLELPIENQPKEYVFRVKEYVFRVKESNKMGFKSKSAILYYLPWQLDVKYEFFEKMDTENTQNPTS